MLKQFIITFNMHQSLVAMYVLETVLKKVS